MAPLCLSVWGWEGNPNQALAVVLLMVYVSEGKHTFLHAVDTSLRPWYACCSALLLLRLSGWFGDMRPHIINLSS